VLTVEFNKLGHLNEAKMAIKEAKPLELYLVPVKEDCGSPKSSPKQGGGSLRARKGDTIVREKIDKIEWKPGSDERKEKKKKKSKEMDKGGKDDTANGKESAKPLEGNEPAAMNGNHTDTAPSTPAPEPSTQKTSSPTLVVSAEEPMESAQPALTRTTSKRKKHKRKTKSVSSGSGKPPSKYESQLLVSNANNNIRTGYANLSHTTRKLRAKARITSMLRPWNLSPSRTISQTFMRASTRCTYRLCTTTWNGTKTMQHAGGGKDYSATPEFLGRRCCSPCGYIERCRAQVRSDTATLEQSRFLRES